MTMLAAFQVLLYRYTMQEEIAVGTPVANRNHSEVEGLIGFFLNTLVMRTSFAGEPSFRELLGRVREMALGAYAHQNLPFEKLVEELQPERQLNRTPFFQVMFALRSIPKQTTSCAGLMMEPVWVESGTSKFDLLLFLDETSDGLKGVFEYNTDLFEPATIERMGAHFMELLESIVADPSTSVAQLSMLGEQERRQLIADWNSTAGDYPSEQSLRELFESQAEQTPDAIALVFDDEQVTYRELNSRSNQFACYLRRLGAAPDVFVGIMMRRSFEMVYSVLGTLKAGAAYVALDPVLPRERLSMILEDTDARVVLTSSDLMDRLPEFVNAIPVDEELARIEIEFSDNGNNSGPLAATSENLAYVTYTSGSTGRPKGIAMPQRAVRNLLEWQLTNTILPPLSRTLQFASLSFDVSFQDMFSTWAIGGAVVLITEEQRGEIGGLARLLQEKEIRRLFIPAVALQQLAEGFCALETGSAALRKVIAGSEQLQITRSIARMFGEIGSCSLHNEYGPSETHVVTELALPASPAEWPERPCVGTPILNAQIYILDHYMQPVPAGIPGELFIGGAGLARCYLNRPELVADRFIPDPFGGAAGARLYKTGDLARWLPNGEIEFLGRIDFQVKIRGFRVEPGEIETVLGSHDRIKEAVVLARDDAPGGKRLVAYLVCEPEDVPAIGELRKFLAEKLPDYMIPSAFVFLEAMPLTPNGKVNRRALPVPGNERPELEKEYAPPRSALEDVLAAYWAEILRIERVGINDNFFELGGHSLLAAQLVSRIKDEFQIELPLRGLFEAPTVSGLAERMCLRCMPENLEEVALSLIELRNISDEEAAELLSMESF
jgi:amino acid adenylation domain-containing protein